jgi:LPXTG-motif cell wall-anchored protein
VRAQQTADPLEGQTATIVADSIGPIAVAGCEEAAGETASITVAAAADDATEEVFTDDAETIFQFGQQGITITSEGDGTDFLGNLDGATGNDGKVVRSGGIVCDDSGGGQRANDANTAADDDNTAQADDLENLGCEELLVLFRGESGSGAQYADAAAFAEADVRAQVEVCLKKEIVDGPDGNLPNTGGLSLLALAVLGAASAAAGLSVIRGGRRQG